MTTIVEFRENVDKISWQDKEIYLVGTAHISEESVVLVEEIIRETSPDTVAVELCKPRFSAIRNQDAWKKTDIVTVIRQGKASVLMAQLVLAAFQRKIGKQLGIKPGAEMHKAIEVAEELGMEVALVDREVRTTLRRVWSSVSLIDSVNILNAAVTALFTKQEVSAEEIERLKKSDVLFEALDEFATLFPRIKRPLIDERDEFLTAMIRDLPGKTIVAVVGAGHCPGIKKLWAEPIDLDTLKLIPPQSLWVKGIGWAFSLIIIGLLGWVFATSGLEKGVELLGWWSAIAIGATFFTSLSLLAHPLAILLGSITSPVTSLVPFIKPGVIVGLTEAFFRKPSVSDMESVLDDITSFWGWYSNKVLRVLLLILAINLVVRFAHILFTFFLINEITKG